MYLPHLWIYLGEMTRYTIVTWIFGQREQMVLLVWLKDVKYYTSLQVYHIIMQWHNCLGYHLKRGMCASQVQGVSNYCNIVNIPICHFVQMYSCGESRLVGSIRFNLEETRPKFKYMLVYNVVFQWNGPKEILQLLWKRKEKKSYNSYSLGVLIET